MTGAIPPQNFPDPSTWTGFVFYAPDDQEWFAVVNSALMKLSYGYYWDKDYPTWDQARDMGRAIATSWINRAQQVDTVYDLTGDWIDSSDGTVDGFLNSIIDWANANLTPAQAADIEERIRDLTYPITGATAHESSTPTATYDGGTQIFDFGLVRGAKGDPGDGGIYGVAGNPSVPSSEVVRCSIAQGCTDYLSKKAVSSFQQLKGAFEAGASVGAAISDLVESVPVLGNAVKATSDFVANLDLGHFDDLIGLAQDPDWQHKVFCHLYCALPDSGMIDQSTFDTWQSGVFHEPPQGPLLTLIGQAEGLLITALGLNTFKAQAIMYQNDNNDNCEPCADCLPNWCYEFDFAASDGGWTAIEDVGSIPYWVSGVGWHSSPNTDSGHNFNAALIRKTFTETNITKILFTSTSSGTTDGVYISIFAGTTNVYHADNQPNGDRSDEVTGDWTVSQIDLRTSANNQAGTTIIKTAKIWGTGTNPFGTSNC